MKRRFFLNAASTTLAATFLSAHNLFAEIGFSKRAKINSKPPLIKLLTLQTICPLSELREFYKGTLGLEIEKESQNELTILAGETPITFEYMRQSGYRPFYHFAFNIPENKIYKAFEWQKRKTPLVNPGFNNHDRDPMKEVVHFDTWNAHSIFFLDPAGNLLEYIARHDLANAAEGDFSSKDILYASEIGFITDDIDAVGKSVMKSCQLTEYRPQSPGFWPIGDEHGLLLMINKGRMWSSNPGQVNKTDVFKTQVMITDAEMGSEWELPEYPYVIRHA